MPNAFCGLSDAQLSEVRERHCHFVPVRVMTAPLYISTLCVMQRRRKSDLLRRLNFGELNTLTMNREKKKEYYARIGFCERITPEDKVFACLICCGYSASQAYIIAYPTKASINSAAALASRKVGSWEIQAILRYYKRMYDNGSVAFPDHLIKN